MLFFAIAAVPNPSPAPRFTANSLTGASCALALLYFGREMLEPVTLAGILSLVAAPLVSRLQQSGLSRLHATLVTLLVTASCVAGTVAALATQLVSVGNELPQYRAALHQKATQLRTAADNLLVLASDALSTVNPHTPSVGAASPEPRPLPQPLPAAAAETGGGDALTHVAKLAWEPLGKAGLVLVLLMFILLEHESLQDRLVRLGRKTEISRTIRALADAAQGVSRFFLSQFVINGAFGVAVGTGLWALSIPHPLLWGTCSAVMRFVPYLGALAAGAAIACFAAAIDPGWGLALSVVVMFGTMELVLSNVIEPKVYGRSTGLSPLAVVLSALFWGTIWGPVGLLISTPLTLCIVVAGRYVAALEFLSIMLGEVHDVPAAQRFFQRALSGDITSILRGARRYLRRDGFARYCDHTLLPGLALAATELRLGVIDTRQQQQLRHTVAEIAEALVPRKARATGRRRVPLLYNNIGAHLRQLRESRLGQWQGPLDVPRRSIILCAGLSTERDELVGELLALALREEGRDARSVALPLPLAAQDTDKAELVSTIFIPCPLADAAGEWRAAIHALKGLAPHALLAAIRLPGDDFALGQSATEADVDIVLHSFAECLAFVNAHRP